MRAAPTPFFQTHRVPAPPGVAGIFHTLHVMRKYVNNAKLDGAIIQAATSVIWHAIERDEIGQAVALFEYVRDHIKYVKDPVGVESVSNPAFTLSRMVGDCDDQSVLLASLYESVGFPTRFIVAGYTGKTYEHVYLQVYIDGVWYDCDPTEQQAFGWAPPNSTVYYAEQI